MGLSTVLSYTLANHLTTLSKKVEDSKGVCTMGDKEFKDCMDKLVEATDNLSNVTERMGKTVDKMIDYCTVITLVMFITIVLAIVF